MLLISINNTSPAGMCLWLSIPEVQKLQPPSFSLNIAVAVEFFIAFQWIPWAVKAGWNDVIEIRNSSTRCRMTSLKVKVGWMISWLKCDKLGDHWIKRCKSSMWANSTLLRSFLRMPKSLVTTSPCAKFYSRSTGNQNGGRESGSTYTWNYRWNICKISTEFVHLFWVEKHGGTNVSTVQRQGE